jgi:hypothetical protein
MIPLGKLPFSVSAVNCRRPPPRVTARLSIVRRSGYRAATLAARQGPHLPGAALRLGVSSSSPIWPFLKLPGTKVHCTLGSPPPALAHWLAAQGHDAALASAVGLDRSSDTEILTREVGGREAFPRSR